MSSSAIVTSRSEHNHYGDEVLKVYGVATAVECG